MTASQTATVTVSVTDAGPTAVADSASTNEDAAINVNVLANDHAEDAGDHHPLTGVQATSLHGAAVTIAGNSQALHLQPERRRFLRDAAATGPRRPTASATR